ncbi:hypothetical protein AUG19_00605 [archaeon 13_1_20CM_2_54_9]|nr:MAG: hypothetical protein AUJ07_03225 [Crenarchaeota archaeon 13_1_40CM_3_53_5]OLE77397.1 MAG: hypothetical protein AUG19_00605 [archaeon 13_1_20CM_2_54_9]TMI21902.1 MAG: hypothetical protein E6H36_12395 [Candidatus Bathyarchaeota archaeon]TMI32039.1 MAG: hypothetical protein E6H29_03155 [Candidatus Bathyarchaeota archaeon]
MGDNKPSKEWSPFSKEIKLDEKDWAVVEGLFQNHRNTVGVISKADFVKQLVLDGASSLLVQIKQADPEALKRISTTSQSFQKKN